MPLSRSLNSLIARSCLFLLLLSFHAYRVSAQTFTMDESFLRTMQQRDTIQPTFRVRINAHGPLHQLANDCEMHVAGTVQDASLGTPSAIIVEFPNWCLFNPDGQQGDSFNTLTNKWDTFAGSNLDNKTCNVTGFLRIFTEHAQGAGGATNPNHAYEYHPALSMACGTQTFSFTNMLGAPAGLRHISNSAASNCIAGRQLQVRFKNHIYEFQESGGGSCGNFAIVKASAINLNWSFAINGGHYTFATVTADGQHSGGIGVYTLTGSDLDSWLAQTITQGGMGNTTKTIHGVFTYDWEAIFDTLSDDQGNLLHPSQWKTVEFPMALIAYGEATAPF